MKNCRIAKCLVFTAILLLPALLSAQKKPGKEKPPTKKEMEQAMNDARGMMDEMMKEMSPEDKKMMDSLGIKMPDMKKAAKNLEGISDKKLAQAWEDDNRIVPKKDAARIAAIPPPVSDAGIAKYVSDIQAKAAALIKPESKAAAEKIYTYIQTKKFNSNHAGGIAMSLWLYGKPEAALFLLGKICAADPTNTDNTSNYAAMLTMQGGQHLAIPLLNNLNRKFKWNSTLLNNLGQAWFGLGDIDKADKYLDSTLALYPFHPQANLTRAAIEESKGNIKKAEEAIKKSIKHAYSPEKENMLKKLGYKLTDANLYIPFVRKGDLLELGKIRRPDYPYSVKEAIKLHPIWEGFRADCKQLIQKLEKQMPDATTGYMEHAKKTAASIMKDVQNGIIRSQNLLPLYARKASLAATRTTEYYEERLRAYFVPKGIDQLNGLLDIRKKHKNPPPEAPCMVHQNSKSDLIKKLNTFRKPYDDEFLDEYRRYLNDMGHWAVFTSTDPNMLKAISIQFQLDYIRKAVEFGPEFESVTDKTTLCEEGEEDNKPYGKLKDFDFTNACKYKSTITFGNGAMEINCTHTTWKFNSEFVDYSRTLGPNDVYERSSVVLKPKIGASGNAGPLKAGASFGADITLNYDTKGLKDWNAVVKAEAQLGVGGSVGPVAAEVTAGVAVEVEIDNTGKTDVNYITKAGAKAGIEAPKIEGSKSDELDETINAGIDKVNDAIGGLKGTSVEIGIENRTNLISGNSLRSGTGALSGIKF